MEVIDWRSCHSMAEMPEQERLEVWARAEYERLERDLLTIEIGSFHGQSTAIFAQFGQVIAIDLHGDLDAALRKYDGIGLTGQAEFISNMKRLNIMERRVHLVTSSSSFLDLFEEEINADIIYIDAGHSYEDVKLDIRRSERHVAPGGLLAFDDYKRPGWGYPPYDPNHPHHGPHDPWHGVARAVDEFQAAWNYEVVEHYLGKLCLRK